MECFKNNRSKIAAILEGNKENIYEKNFTDFSRTLTSILRRLFLSSFHRNCDLLQILNFV